MGDTMSHVQSPLSHRAAFHDADCTHADMSMFLLRPTRHPLVPRANTITAHKSNCTPGAQSGTRSPPDYR
jgi:hypothetical protein